MFLSTTTEHAIRALVRLAQSKEGERLSGDELARSARIPGPYMVKVMLAMRNAGWVATVRGTGGGYRLIKPAGEIRLADIVRLFEGPGGEPACLLKQGACQDGAPCPAHAAWKKVQDVLHEFLNQTTLAQLAHRPNMLP